MVVLAERIASSMAGKISAPLSKSPRGCPRRAADPAHAHRAWNCDRRWRRGDLRARGSFSRDCEVQHQHGKHDGCNYADRYLYRTFMARDCTGARPWRAYDCCRDTFLSQGEFMAAKKTSRKAPAPSKPHPRQRQRRKNFSPLDDERPTHKGGAADISDAANREDRRHRAVAGSFPFNAAKPGEYQDPMNPPAGRPSSRRIRW